MALQAVLWKPLRTVYEVTQANQLDRGTWRSFDSCHDIDGLE
ncbi:MAG: hypothetical protein ACLVKJ_04660 [Acutalibacteraceae bacterium]